jgi:hypothetical protein
VDYNHPEIAANIHFQLDRDGHPVRLGWDYVGNDNWPAPYIGRTDPHRNRYELWVIDQLTRNNPELKIYLDTRRAVLQEYLSSAAHGQKVGAAMVAGRADFGLLAYRYGPINYEKDTAKVQYYGRAMQSILAGAKQAIADGAKIIVIPACYEGHIEDGFDEAAKKQFDQWNDMCRQFRALALSVPETLFVVPLGNNNGHRVGGNNETRIHFMAGIEAPNIVRVGAVNERGKIASFSNSASINLYAVYVEGENIATLVPTRMSVPPANYAQTYRSIMDSINEGNESYESVGQVLLLFSKNEKQFSHESGTSMSVGIYGNLAARIWADHPNLKLADVICRIEGQIQSGKIAGYVQHKFDDLARVGTAKP